MVDETKRACYSILEKGERNMMKVGIQLDDLDFGRAFVRGLATEGRNICFSLLDDALTMDDMDFILTERDMDDTKYICLVKSEAEERIYEGPPYRMFRYQHACDFVKGLFYIFHRETGRVLEFSGDIRCRILAFVSMTGSVENTALALLTAERLYQHFGSRCLYLNLCPLDVSKCFFPEGRSKGLLTLLYHLSQENDFPLSSFIKQHSYIDCIDTSISNPYFDELNSKELHRLLKKIDDLGKYTYLILDMGNHLSRCNKSLLSKAEAVIMTLDEKYLLPDCFFQEVCRIVEHVSEGVKLKKIFLDCRALEKVTSDVKLREHELMDLSAMQYIHWEAGRLAKEIMEQSDVD